MRHARRRRSAPPRLVALTLVDGRWLPGTYAHPDDDLPDGLERNSEGRLVFVCVACGRRGCDWDAPASEFDPDNRDHRLGSCGPGCTP